MNKSQTAYPINYHPLQLGIPGAFFIYMFLLLKVAFGGAVAPFVWWLVLALPLSAILQHFATRRILWQQVCYILNEAALILVSWSLLHTTVAALAPDAQGFITAATAVSVVLMGVWGHLWAKQRLSVGRNGLETRTPAQASGEEPIALPRRRWSIHSVSLPVKVLTVSAMVSGAVKLLSFDSKTAVMGVLALFFAWFCAWALGHTLYAFQLTRAWERKHRQLLLLHVESGRQKRQPKSS